MNISSYIYIYFFFQKIPYGNKKIQNQLGTFPLDPTHLRPLLLLYKNITYLLCL